MTMIINYIFWRDPTYAKNIACDEEIDIAVCKVISVLYTTIFFMNGPFDAKWKFSTS